MKKHDMIFNQFHHFCKTCPFKEEINNEFVLHGDNEPFFTYMIVTCEHFNRCGYVKYMISKEGTENETV